MKLLIVEDDRFMAQILSEILWDFGLECEIATSTEDTLSRRIESFDAFIVDIMLPNDPHLSGISDVESRAGFHSGIALARKIRQSNSAATIILISNIEVNKNFDKPLDTHFISKGDGLDSLMRLLRELDIIADVPTRSFIVHGHDNVALLELKDFIQNSLGWSEPVVLRDSISSGKTIIEKFEEYSSTVDYVFVLMTPDDCVIKEGATNDDKRRARQNVVFELGFFYGFIGRTSGRIIVLYKGPLELPSDIHGIVYIDISDGIKKAGEVIRQELGG